MKAYKFASVGFPGRNLIFVRHRQVYGINHDTISCGLCARCVTTFQKTLVITGVMLFMETGGEAKIAKLDVTTFVAKKRNY